MFDTAKVQRMTMELIKFTREQEIYIVPEIFDGNAFVLFRRLNVKVRAIISDIPLYSGAQLVKEIFGVPILKTSEASANFTEHTGIIILSKNPLPLIKTTLNFVVRGRLTSVPVFTMASPEILAIYDRLTLINVLQQYQADGLGVPTIKDVAIRFARGATTFLNPDTENIKVQLWNRNDFTLPKYDVDDTAIVLRGQIVYENRYTEKTFEFYRAIYPNVPIVVSTWEADITPEFRKACKENSVVLLGNTPPEFQGWGHINYQLENGSKGVEYVQKNTGVKFIMVGRTDQRLNKFDFLIHFRNLIQEFPPHGDKLQGRFIVLGTVGTRKYSCPFAISDYLTFAYSDDTVKLYSLPQLKDNTEFRYRKDHGKRLARLKEIGKRLQFVEVNLADNRKKLRKFNLCISKFNYANDFWMKALYRKYIAPIDKTKILETWWKFIKDYLLLVDMSPLLLDWRKYEKEHSYANVLEGMDFSQWLDLYRNFNADWV